MSLIRRYKQRIRARVAGRTPTIRSTKENPMPLYIPEAPNEAAALVRSNFQAFAERGHFRLPALRNAVGPLQIAQSHQVFTLGLKDLTAGRGLQAAQQAGWRFLIHDAEKVVAAAETAATGADHVFAGFNEGPFVASTAEAI